MTIFKVEKTFAIATRTKMNFMTSVTKNCFILHINHSLQDVMMKNMI